MLNFVPEKVFFVKGKWVHEDELVSFELALRDAGVEMFNFVPVSSIYPPGCQIIDAKDWIKLLSPGQIVFCVMARYSSNKSGEKIFASVWCAFPEDKNKWWYFTEYHGTISSLHQQIELSKVKTSIDFFGVNLDWNIDGWAYAEQSARYMLQTWFGQKVAWSKSIYQEAIVEKWKWTSVIAMAVFV